MGELDTAETRYKIPYRPRPLQREFHKAARRFTVAVCHRRYGKTVMAINEALKRGLQCKWPRPQVFYIAPTYQQAERVAWQYLKLFAGVLPGVKFNEAKLRCTIPLGDGRGDITFYLLGAEDPDSIRGMYADFVCMDEFAVMRPRIWSEIVRPMLTEREGGAIWIGTPKGLNAFHERFEHARDQMARGSKDWLAIIHKAEDTGIIPADELAAAKADMSEDEFDQEFGCSFTAAIKGAYFAEELERAGNEGRIGSVIYEPRHLVHSAWDLGFRDSTFIWLFQEPKIGREVRFIDCIEASGEGLDFYLRQLSLKPYVYGEHYFPHDVQVHELGTGMSRLEMLREKGIRGRVAAKLPKPDQIAAARRELGICWFDTDRCKVGIEHLRHYRKGWDDRLQVFRSSPLHDEHSNAADAFQTFAVSRRDVSEAQDLRQMARTGRMMDGRPVRVQTSDADIFG